MRTELEVQGKKREVQEAVSRFFKEHKDLYQGVTGPGRFTGYSLVEAKVNPRYARHVAKRSCLAMIAGFFALEAMDTIGGDPNIKVAAKPAGEGKTRLKITTEDGVKPEAIDPLLTWLNSGQGPSL